MCLSLCIVSALAQSPPGENSVRNATASDHKPRCGSFPMAKDLRTLLEELGVKNLEQCRMMDLSRLLGETRQGVLIFTGGVREHCITAMQRLNQVAPAGSDASPVDDEDTMPSGDRPSMTEVCEIPQPKKLASLPSLELSAGINMKPLVDVLKAAEQMLNFLETVTPPLNDDTVQQRIDELKNRRQHWVTQVNRVGVVEGYQNQLDNLKNVHNVTDIALSVCQYAFPECTAPVSSEQPSKAIPLLSPSHRSCFRWRATDVLLHPRAGKNKSMPSELANTFYWKFMSEQCPEVLPSAVTSQQLSKCFQYSTTGACSGQQVYTCPGHLQQTDNPDNWVGQAFTQSIQASSGININTSMPAPCSFPCGVRCRDSQTISDDDVKILRQLRLASFFVLLASSVVGLAVAIFHKNTVLLYPQRLTVYMCLIFLLWSLHYLPSALVDVEPHLCNSDKTARLSGHKDSQLCTFTMVTFYGFHIVFQSMAVLGAITLWARAHSLNPLTRISVGSGCAHLLEMAAFFTSLFFGAVGVAVLISQDEIVPSVTAGHCTVSKEHFSAAVLYPFGVGIALHCLVLLTILVEFAREHRRSKKMRRYAVNVNVHTESKPAKILHQSFCFSLIYLVWCVLVYWYMISLEYYGEKTTVRTTQGSFECSLATCGSATCTDTSASSHFFPILIAFIVISLACGLIFTMMIVVVAGKSTQGDEMTSEPGKKKRMAIITAKQLSNATLTSPDLPLPPPPFLSLPIAPSLEMDETSEPNSPTQQTEI